MGHRLGFAVRWFGCERGRCAVKMGVDSRFVGTNVIDATHDQQLVGQGFERFKNAVVSFLLQRCGDAEPKENVEGASRYFGGR